MINTFARANAEVEAQLWLDRLHHVQVTIRMLTSSIIIGEHLGDCLVSGEGRHIVTHMSQAVDMMKMAVDSLEHEETRIRRELDNRGIAP